MITSASAANEDASPRDTEQRVLENENERKCSEREEKIGKCGKPLTTCLLQLFFRERARESGERKVEGSLQRRSPIINSQ